jgi:subtilisin family serine protease
MIDTGIDYFHPDLQNKIYQNPGEMGMTSPGDAFGKIKDLTVLR